MTDLDEPQLVPIVEIVHVSDWHLGEAIGGSRRELFKLLCDLRPELHPYLNDGIGVGDEDALDRFETLLESLFPPDDRSNLEIDRWLVFTGDLTTWGDDESIRNGLNRLESWRRRFRFTDSLYLFGNHDAWPATFPLTARRNLHAHYVSLREKYFPETFPCRERRAVAPEAEVRMLALNTVKYGRIRNTLAIGRIDDDYWPGKARDSAGQLPGWIERVRRRGERPVLQLLATHHPFVFPGGGRTDRVWSRGDIHGCLQCLPTPRPILVLSGHTHQRYPELGAAMSSGGEFPLLDDQIQVIAGSLAQAPTWTIPQRVEARTHEAQVLRVNWDAANDRFLIQRIVYWKPIAAFPFAPKEDANGDTSEWLAFPWTIKP